MVTEIETQKAHILLIEDNARDVRLIEEHLLNYTDTPLVLEWVDRLSLGLQRIQKGGIDLVLLDLTLPDSQWLDTFTKLHAHVKDIPIVVLSGINNKAHALELVKLGAQDYLVKGEVNHDALIRSIRYSLERHKLQDNLHKLYTKIEKNQYQLENFIQFSRQLNLSHNLKEILELSKKTLPFLFQAEFFSIFLLDTKTNELVLTTHNHSEWEHLKTPFRVTEDGGIMWDTIRKREMIEIKNFSSSSYVVPWKNKKYKNDAAICVPLMVKEDVLGVLNLNNFPINSNSDTNIHNIKRVSDHLSMAIHNAILIQRIEEMSITDDLTQLFNRRFIRGALLNEIERAKRYGDVFSVALIDVDRFKKINDSKGHIVGDAVLKKIVDRIKFHLRITDLACRLGGDEFVIILPKTRGMDGLTLAEKWRQDVETQRMHVEGAPEFHITISVGIYEYRNGDDMDTVLNHADTALYMAKEKGRNKCVRL